MWRDKGIDRISSSWERGRQLKPVIRPTTLNMDDTGCMSNNTDFSVRMPNMSLHDRAVAAHRLVQDVH